MATTPNEASGGSGPFRAVGEMAYDAVRAQQRTLELAQGWSETLVATLKEQAETYGVLLRSVNASLLAMEQAVKSQAQVTQALADSLEASRQIVQTATDTHQHSFERVETFVGGMLEVLSSQLQALRTQINLSREMFSDPVSAQGDVFLKMTQDWTDAYSQLLGSASPFFRRAGEAG
jgi:hypothetical protein